MRFLCRFIGSTVKRYILFIYFLYTENKNTIVSMKLFGNAEFIFLPTNNKFKMLANDYNY